MSGCKETPPPIAIAEPSPALWLVENSDGEREGWLFGTIHALPDGVEWRTPAIQVAIDGSAALAVEISELDDAEELSAIFTELARSPHLPPLIDRVSADNRVSLASLMDAAGYDSGDFSGIETWAAALTLAQANAQGSSENGVDKELFREIGELRVLEGARAQLSIFDALPEREQRDLLEAIATNSAIDQAREWRELVEIWLTGDMKRLAQKNDEGFLADPELRAALLTDRNTAWAIKIDGWMQRDGPILVAAGASHMAGPDGLPVLLAERGYTIRRIQ
ncbi:MAG: TraB/GumN family protein [Pontixanthobacter sp.]